MPMNLWLVFSITFGTICGVFNIIFFNLHYLPLTMLLGYLIPWCLYFRQEKWLKRYYWKWRLRNYIGKTLQSQKIAGINQQTGLNEYEINTIEIIRFDNETRKFVIRSHNNGYRLYYSQDPDVLLFIIKEYGYKVVD